MKNTDKSSLLNILKNMCRRLKDKCVNDGDFEDVLRDLKKHRNTFTKDNASLFRTVKWLIKLAKILSSFLKIIKPAIAIKAIIDEISKTWDQLTFKQKLQVVLLGPVIGIGIFVGNIGVALLGTAVGIPVIFVILILLFVTKGLIEFLDCLIKLSSSFKK